MPEVVAAQPVEQTRRSSNVMRVVVLALVALKAGKLSTAALSMLLSLAIYAGVFGWRYAAGFIACLLAHEMGHVIAARQRGLAVSAPAFIPFLGAFITMRDAPPNVETEAHVAISGPLLGSLAAFGFWYGGKLTGDHLLLAVAYSGFILNLFNLLPLSPLDGGRIVAVLGPRMWLAGVPLLAALFVCRPDPMLPIVGILALPHIVKAVRFDAAAPENLVYYALPLIKKLEYGGMYLALVGGLSDMAYEVHQKLLIR